MVAACPDRKVGGNKVANEHLKYNKCSFKEYIKLKNLQFNYLLLGALNY